MKDKPLRIEEENKKRVINDNTEEIDSIDKPIEEENTISQTDIFWKTIYVFLFIFIVLVILAYGGDYINKKEPLEKEMSTEKVKNSESIIEKYLDKWVDVVVKEDYYDVINSSIMAENLTRNLEQITVSLKDKEQILDQNIELKIDRTFENIYKNKLDVFLDFHYSVIGEYIELGLLASSTINGDDTNPISELIKDKLFDKEFVEKYNIASKELNENFKEIIQSHNIKISQFALEGVDTDLNKENLENFESEINKALLAQEVKAAAVIASRFIPKMVAKITAKMLAKSTGKIATKSVLKGGSKFAAAGTAAMGGVACGPWAPLCSAGLATAAWFGTDKVIVEIDESLNREEFKQELIVMIDEQKQDLKNTLKETYIGGLNEFSEKLKKKYSENIVKKQETRTREVTKRVKVTDKMNE